MRNGFTEEQSRMLSGTRRAAIQPQVMRRTRSRFIVLLFTAEVAIITLENRWTGHSCANTATSNLRLKGGFTKQNSRFFLPSITSVMV